MLVSRVELPLPSTAEAIWNFRSASSVDPAKRSRRYWQHSSSTAFQPISDHFERMSLTPGMASIQAWNPLLCHSLNDCVEGDSVS